MLEPRQSETHAPAGQAAERRLEPRSADNFAQLVLNLAAMKRPVDKQWRDQRRSERQDQQNGDEREKLAHFCQIDLEN